MRWRATAAAVLLAVALLAGCAREHGSAASTPSSSAPSSSASPSGYSEMEKKVAAAESALAQADKDAAEDDTGR